MSAPREATEEERAPLLQVPPREDDAESGVGSAIDFDRRSLIDIAKNPKLLTTLEQGLIILAICLLCLAAIFGGLALGTYDKLRREEDGDTAGPIIRTTTAVQTSTEMITTTATATNTVTQSRLPIPTPPTVPPTKNVLRFHHACAFFDLELTVIMFAARNLLDAYMRSNERSNSRFYRPFRTPV